MPARPARSFIALGGLLLALADCGPGRVRVSYRPPNGSRATYRIEVHAVAVTRIADQPAHRTVDDEVLIARHAVLGGTGADRQVQVELRAPGGEPRSFVVRIDRAAQLAEVQEIEGLPAHVLGGLGLSEIFPEAAGAPPDRSLAPGDRWTIDQPVRIGGPSARLTGSGRLASLGLRRGRKVASIESRYRLPVDRTTGDSPTRLHLQGTQTTTATATRDVADGTIEIETARTSGTFQLFVLPPAGIPGPAIPGTLDVEIRSVTRRSR